MTPHGFLLLAICWALLWSTDGRCQASAAGAATTLPPAQPQSGDSQAPAGTVLFSRKLPAEPAAGAEITPEQIPIVEDGLKSSPEPVLLPNQPDALHVTDSERSSLTFTSYDLDVHLTPASHGVSARVTLGLRNDGPVPLTRLVLQVSSSLRWGGLSVSGSSAALERLAFTTRRIATDADHTGFASEVVATLPRSLAPGASVKVVAVYSGSIAQSAERLERIGAPAADAVAADWDAVAAPDADSSGTSTALRGFGNVLWYPVSAPPVFLGDGARLFDLAGRTRLREQGASIALRLVVEYVGDPPSVAFFCGRPLALVSVRDNPDAPIGEATGVATATFEARPLGFRVPSLFVTDHPSTEVGTSTNPDLIAETTGQFDGLSSYPSAAKTVEPLLIEWLGLHPLVPLSLLDHPGQAFEDGPLLVHAVSSSNSAALPASLIHSLTHAWIHSSRPWIDEGLAQFMSLLWIEQTQGRGAVLAQLGDDARTVGLTEPNLEQLSEVARSQGDASASSSSNAARRSARDILGSDQTTGQPLVNSSSDVFFRSKAAAVWWMLRELVGDEALKKALQTYRVQDPKLENDPTAFEVVLERAAHQDLRWFFEDWVYNDRGLPELSIVNVTPRQLEGTGQSAGWLVSIEVRNDGDCVADVPVTIRSVTGAKSAAASETQRLRIPAHGTVSRRIVFPVVPDEVQVNDGTTPEIGVSTHVEHIVATSK